MIGGGILAVILLAIGAFVVLGGDDDGGSELSQTAFVAAYNEICLEIDADISALDPGSLAEAQEASTQAQQIVDDGIAELRALQPSSDIADDVSTGTLLPMEGGVINDEILCLDCGLPVALEDIEEEREENDGKS